MQIPCACVQCELLKRRSAFARTRASSRVKRVRSQLLASSSAFSIASIIPSFDMFCAISGEPPTTPVVSRKSGLVYERRLILKYIADNEKDPVTGEPLSEEDLVELKLDPRTAVPRPPTLSSVPSLLTSLQNEYDAVMLELFTLKKSYDSVRQELAHALYANDSANRVVARLMWERDEARTALASIKDSLGQNGAAVDGAAAAPHESNGDADDAEMSDASPAGLPHAALAKIDESSKALSSTRKAKLKRKPEGYTKLDDVARFSQLVSLPSMHGTKPPGVTALDVSQDGTFLLTGGRDKQVQVYNTATGKIAATLKGHTKDIKRVAFVQSSVGFEHGTASSADGAEAPPAWAVSSANDNGVRVWKATEQGKNAYSLAHTINDFQGPVTGLVAHPSGDFFVAASSDGSWAVYDLSSGSRLLHVEKEQTSFESLDVHPDGVLLALGTTTGNILVYDIRTGQESGSLASDAAGSSINSVSFSENGYMLASATATQAEIWDLRKLTKLGTIAIEGGGDVATTVRFDPSAQFLAVVGQDVRIYANKSWDQLWSSTDAHSAAVTDAKWTWADGKLITASLDRTVRTFAPAQAETEAEAA